MSPEVLKHPGQVGTAVPGTGWGRAGDAVLICRKQRLQALAVELAVQRGGRLAVKAQALAQLAQHRCLAGRGVQAPARELLAQQSPAGHRGLC